MVDGVECRGSAEMNRQRLERGFRVWGRGTDGYWRLATVRLFAGVHEAETVARQLEEVYGRQPRTPTEEPRRVLVLVAGLTPQPATVESRRFVDTSG